DPGQGPAQPGRLHHRPARRRAPAAPPGAGSEAPLRGPRPPARGAATHRPSARDLHARAEPPRRAAPPAGAPRRGRLRHAAPDRRRRAQRAGGARVARRGDREADGAARVITLRQATKTFGAGTTVVRAVDGVSFTCPPGAFWALMG